MEGWESSYWFEEGNTRIVLNFFRQPIFFPEFEVVGSETRLGKIKKVRKNGDGSFDLSDCSSRTKNHRRFRREQKCRVGKRHLSLTVTDKFFLRKTECDWQKKMESVLTSRKGEVGPTAKQIQS